MGNDVRVSIRAYKYHPVDPNFRPGRVGKNVGGFLMIRSATLVQRRTSAQYEQSSHTAYSLRSFGVGFSRERFVMVFGGGNEVDAFNKAKREAEKTQSALSQASSAQASPGHSERLNDAREANDKAQQALRDAMEKLP